MRVPVMGRQSVSLNTQTTCTHTCTKQQGSNGAGKGLRDILSDRHAHSPHVAWFVMKRDPTVITVDNLKSSRKKPVFFNV